MSEQLLETYVKWDDFLVLENANKHIGPTGYFSMLAEMSLEKSVEQILPSKLLKVHKQGIIYIHKLPYSIYVPYCTGHSIVRLLRKGLRTLSVASWPAKHFDTFVDHVANYLITMQHYFSGAQAVSRVEWYAGPFIKADGLSFEQVKQNVQRLVYNFNYPTRIALQSPFINFTMVMDAPSSVKREHGIIGGRDVGELGSYEDQAKMFLLALAKVLYEGDSFGQPFTFPIPTLMVTSRWLWEDPEMHETIFKTAARRGSFYWLNTRIVDPDSTYAMCCRIALDMSELNHAYSKSKFRFGLKRDLEAAREEYWKVMERQRFGGLWAMPDITGSVNVVDVNLPRLALEAKKEEFRFWELYDDALRLVKEAVDWFRHRYIYIMKRYPSFYSMILEYMPEFPTFHFNTIGLIGLPETAAILMQEPKLWLDGNRSDWLRAAELMRKIVEHATATARRWMIEEGSPWNVEEVPGESAAPKLAMLDIRLYPELAEYLPDPENPIYSTSVAPYYAPMELPDKVEVEQRVQKYFTGGVMMHIFLGEEPEPEALASLTKRLVQTELIYWSYTPAVTYCNTCGKTFTGLYTRCPSCGSENVDIWSRIVGYYRPLRNWNPSRKKEFLTRVHYTL